MELHPKFSSWLAADQITPGDDVVRKWWTAVSEFVIDRGAVVALARMAFRTQALPEFETKFVAALQKHDAAFVPGAVVLAILAASRLAVALDDSDERLRNLIVLAVVSANSSGQQKVACLAEIAALAEKTLSNASAHRADWNYVRTGGTSVNDVELLRHAVGVIAEETNMLWWLFGETSRDRNTRFGDIPNDVMPFLAGKELADLTMIVPGPAAMPAIADRAYRSNRAKPVEQIGIAAAIAGLPADWRDTVILDWKDQPILPLAPLTTAMMRSATVRGAAWPSEFVRCTGWSKAHKLSPIQIAHLIYRESLLSKAWRQPQA